MTIATRDHQATASKPKLTLTRTRTETARWAAHAAVTSWLVPTRSTPRHDSERQRVVLTRTPKDTVRWVLRATPWGVIGVITSLGVLAAALLGLWLLVPSIDALSVSLMTSLKSAFAWAVDQISAFPGWLGTLLATDS